MPTPRLPSPLACLRPSRRIVYAALLGLALLLAAVPAFASHLFSDVPDSHWAHDHISRFAALGITTGCGVGIFCPDEAVTRAQMAVFFDRAFRHIPRHNAAPPAAHVTATVDSADDVGMYTSITIGVDGLPVISYYDVTNQDLKVSHCGNALCTAGNTSATVDSTGDVGHYTSITIGTDGLPIISYLDRTNGDLKVAHCGNPACTTGNTLTIVDNTAGIAVGASTSIAIGFDGLPVISYYDSPNGDLKVAHCGNASCSAGNTLNTADSGGDVGLYSSITIGIGRAPTISYYDVTNADLKVAHCNNLVCSTGFSVSTVASAGDVGSHTSITIGADSLPIISYYDESNSDLKVVQCGTKFCASGNTITTVDSSAGSGKDTSITIGTDGLPIISYLRNPGNSLRAVHCGVPDCSTRHIHSTIDSAGDVGQHTAITIGADGLPIISYYDLTNGDLKTAHLGSILGIPYWRRR